MLLEGRQTIPLSKLKEAHTRLKSSHSALEDDEMLERQGKFWTNSGFTLGLLYNLFDSPQGVYSRILGTSHIERHRTDDLIELYSPFNTKTLGLYCFADGGVNFSLRNDTSKGESHQGEYPKVPSTNSTIGDAKFLAEYLREYAKLAHSRVQIDGPNDEEHIVVMTSPHVNPLAGYGKREIIGIVFRPIVKGNNRALHGLMQLLVQEKP